MKVKLTVETYHPETGAPMNTLGPHVRTVPERDLHAEVDSLIATFCDHYSDTPSERRPVVTMRIEFVD